LQSKHSSAIQSSIIILAWVSSLLFQRSAECKVYRLVDVSDVDV